MRSRYKVTEADRIHFLTSTVVGWLPLFTRRHYFDVLINSLQFCRQHKGLKLYAYVILENHLHLVAEAPDLSGTMQAFKSYTAREIVRLLEQENRVGALGELAFQRLRYKEKSTHQVWQEGFHPQLLATPEMLRQKIEYVHNNPVNRGYVDTPEHWRYSSARNYMLGDHSVIEVKVV